MSKITEKTVTINGPVVLCDGSSLIYKQRVTNISRIIKTITAPILLYLCFVLVSMTLNPQDWAFESRFFFVIFAIGVVIVAATFPDRDDGE